jgi:NTP pyrophosphatase (non-canonical NTP hydrolase)
MKIAKFQQWTRNADANTQWNLLTTPQLLAHLTEEIGEVAQSVNRIYGYAQGEEKEQQLANLKLELVEAFWFLIKLANRFDIDLDSEVENFVGNADEWLDKYHSVLVRGLQSLDRELSVAKDALNL